MTIGPIDARSGGLPPGGRPEHHPQVRGGPAVLDIGGDVGALVVTMCPQDVGRELRLLDEAAPARDVHTGVWRRHSQSGEITTAVFGELRRGWYRVLDETGSAIRRVRVSGGEVSMIDLRPRSLTPRGSSSPARINMHRM